MSRSSRARFPILLLAAWLIPFCASAWAQDLSKAVQASLLGKLNTKSAKVGDTIAAETAAGTKLGDGKDLPKGSKIVGTVTAVQSEKAGGGASLLIIRFDRIERKGAAPMTAASFLVAVAPPPDPTGNDDFNGTPGSSMGSGQKAGLNHMNRDPDAVIPLGSSIDHVTFDENEGAGGLSTLHGSHKDINLEKDGLVRIYFP
jgi:hypothetical protein